MPPPEPGPPADLAAFVRIANAASMMRAVLDAPDLSDYQRVFGQGVVWSRLLGPALERVDPQGIEVIRASLDVAEAAMAFRDAGAAAAARGAAEVDSTLRLLDAALNRLELLEPMADVEQAARTEEFLGMLRADIPADG